MIKDNLLANRLNAFKAGKEIPENKNVNDTKSLITNETLPSNNESNRDIANRLVAQLVIFVVYAIIFGFATRTLLSANWNFFQWISVGLAIEIVVKHITHYLNNKK